MYAYRIKVFHVADNDTVVIGITHNLVFNFLHAGNTLLNQTLSDRAITNTRFDCFAQLFFVIADPAAGSAECISRAYNQWKTNSLSELHSFFQRRNDGAIRYRLFQFTH
ncbi:hypothetical protein D3C71_1598110 [compost metagenome]